MPWINAEVYNVALQEFAKAVGAGPDKHIILVVDGAGWHAGQEVTIPHGIHLVFLPPYSPELQPAERLWPLVNEEVANKNFSGIDEFETSVITRCLNLRTQPKLIQGLTSFHWWTELDSELRSGSVTAI